MPSRPPPSPTPPLEDLLDHLADGMLVLDPARRIRLFNRAMEEITGLDRQAVLGRPVASLAVHARAGDREFPSGLCPPEGFPDRPGETYLRTLRLTRDDGALRVVQLRFQALPDAAGGPGSLVGLVRDLTPETEWQRERDLARAPDNLGSLGFQLAHEVLNPLHSLDIQAQLLARLLRRPGDAEPEPSEVHDTLRQMRREIRRLSTMLSETLQLRRPETGLHARADVAALLESLRELIAGTAQAQGVTLVVDLQEGLPRVRMDVDRLRRALLNLAINALEAMPSGGELRLLARSRGERVTLTVADTGPGLPEPESGKHFQMFYTSKPSGTGMGLPLARSIVEEHGGTLRQVDAEVGAEFEVSLPVA